jgi:hypothetical protein
MNARALRRFELALPNDPYIINTTTFQLASDQHEWRTGRIDVATTTITLPKANGSGAEIWLATGIIAVSQVIQTSGSDKLVGVIDIGATASTNKNVFAGAGTAVKVTLNGSTQGGAEIGDQLFFTDLKAAVWMVTGWLLGSGSIVTPFS